MEKIIINALVEIAGFPKEHIEKSMNSVIEKIESDKEIKINRKELADLKESNKIWSTFVDLELEIKTILKLFHFCYEYLPSSVEIIEPKDMKIEAKSLSDLINDMLSTMHQYNAAVQNLAIERKALKSQLDSKSQKSA